MNPNEGTRYEPEILEAPHMQPDAVRYAAVELAAKVVAAEVRSGTWTYGDVTLGEVAVTLGFAIVAATKPIEAYLRGDL